MQEKLGAIAFSIAGLATLGACAPPPDPLVAPFVGRVLVSEGAEITVNADGTLSGTVGVNNPQALTGNWAVRDGDWCRTITAPERLAGTECQTVTLDGDQVSFESASGRTNTLTIR